MQVHVHLIKGFLEVLDVRGCDFDERVAVAQVRAQNANLVGRAKGSAQEANGVEVLQPLAVEDVGFTARDIFDMPSID